jgi:hypothetical protein
MRKLMQLSGLVGIVLFVVASANAGTLYRWTNADGVISYSDDLKRIPEAFRADAVQIPERDLATYERYTPSKAPTSDAYVERLNAHIERLRALNADAEAEQRARRSRPMISYPTTAVAVGGRNAIAIPREMVVNDDEPVVVEERRVRTGDSTTHIYVVRQGDRILQVVRPNTNHSDADWPTEEELLEGR